MVTKKPLKRAATVKKVTDEEWEKARILWESDPTMSNVDVGKILGVTKQAVQLRSKHWKKVSDQGDLERRAYDKADEAAIKTNAAAALEEHPSSPVEPKTLAEKTVETAVELRAKILERHRKEWDGARNNIYKAIQTSDFEKAKLGKITAEAIKIVQDGERKAWGFDKEEKVARTDTVIINRV